MHYPLLQGPIIYFCIILHTYVFSTLYFPSFSILIFFVGGISLSFNFLGLLAGSHFVKATSHFSNDSALLHILESLPLLMLYAYFRVHWISYICLLQGSLDFL